MTKVKKEKLSVSIPEDLLIKFRQRAIEKFGTPKREKGALSQAAEEAIRLWLEKEGVL